MPRSRCVRLLIARNLGTRLGLLHADTCTREPGLRGTAALDLSLGCVYSVLGVVSFCRSGRSAVLIPEVSNGKRKGLIPGRFRGLFFFRDHSALCLGSLLAKLAEKLRKEGTLHSPDSSGLRPENAILGTESSANSSKGLVSEPF